MIYVLIILYIDYYSDMIIKYNNNTINNIKLIYLLH